MKFWSHIKWNVLGTGLGLLWIWVTFGDLLFHPGEYLFSVGGDGVKAYTTLTWQLLYGEGVWHEMYMYPHGTHLMNVDANPLLYLITRFLSAIGFTWTPVKVVGLINTLMILGLLPAIWLLISIGRRLGLKPILSVLTAVSCVALSPQIFRFGGHFSLAWYWMIPLWWWLLLEWKDRNWSLSFLGWYLGCSVMLAFVHPYLGLMSGAFLICFQASRWFLESKTLPNLHGKWIPFLVAFLPAIILMSWRAMTGPGVDAVTYPFGFRFYRAGLESVFVANEGPVREFIDGVLKIRHYTMEGYAYVGLTGAFLTVALLVLWIMKIRSKERKSLFPSPPHTSLRLSVLSAAILLFFAMVIPVNWIGFLEDYLGPVRQFRAPGRLALIVYYLLMMSLGWVLMSFFDQLNKTQVVLSWFVLIAGIGTWAVEGWVHTTTRTNQILGQAIKDLPEWTTDWNKELTAIGIDHSQYQALVALPFFSHGSEKIYRGNWYSERYGHLMAASTGLPLVNNYAARASLSQTVEALQLVSHPVIPRSWADSLPSQAPLLIIYPHNEKLSVGEEWLLTNAKELGSIGEVRFLEINPEDLHADLELRTKLATTPDSLEGSAWIEEGFGDDLAMPPGRAARSCNRWNPVIWEGTLPPGIDNQEVELSIWIRIDEDSDYLPDLTLLQMDGESVISRQKIITQQTIDVCKGWAIARQIVSLRSFHTILQSNTKNVTYDRLMIRSLDEQVVSRHPDTYQILLWNNYPVGPSL